MSATRSTSSQHPERVLANQIQTAKTELSAEIHRRGVANARLLADMIEASDTCATGQVAADARAQAAESALADKIDSLKSFARALEHRSVEFDRPLHFIRRNWVTIAALVVGNAAIAELLLHFAR